MLISTTSFKSGPRVAVTRNGERLQFPMSHDRKPTAYLFESLDFPLADRRMEAFLAKFPANGAASEPHEHGSEELFYVLTGSIAVNVNGEETILAEGDATLRPTCRTAIESSAQTLAMQLL